MKLKTESDEIKTKFIKMHIFMAIGSLIIGSIFSYFIRNYNIDIELSLLLSLVVFLFMVLIIALKSLVERGFYD